LGGASLAGSPNNCFFSSGIGFGPDMGAPHNPVYSNERSQRTKSLFG
jgi:hypothetical protein